MIIAEFASKNAIWYSHNVRADQKLIVHLHGYELLQDWIEELDVSRCDAIVVASEFYREKAIDLRGWPPEKLKVIPNSVNFGDFNRAKYPDAHYHLGLVGIVPILKRPDRALDLLELLVTEDRRFTLHIRGHMPWNYQWEWKKAAHQDSYRTFFRKIGESPSLLRHVSFEPFAPDMANWLQQIGWLLSPSTRETFHLSAIEGAASGAVPVAWVREGSEEIIGREFNHNSTDAAAQYILDTVTSSGAYIQESVAASHHASRYSVAEVRKLWLDLIFGLHYSTDRPNETPPVEDAVLSRVSEAWAAADPETAIAVLDENIPLTRKSRGKLKHAELYIRGLAAADQRRFYHLLPPVSDKHVSGMQTIMVRPTGASFDAAEISSQVCLFIGVTPPEFLRDRYKPVIDSAICLSPADDLRIEANGFIRFDRWMELVKVRILKTAKSRGYSCDLAVQGPWWLALPVLEAADSLGVPFSWFIDHIETLALINTALDASQTNHYEAQLALQCYMRAQSRIILDNVEIPHGFPSETIDGAVGLPSPSERSRRADFWDHKNFPPSQGGSGPISAYNAPAFLAKAMSNLKLGLVTGRTMGNSLPKVLEATYLTPDQYTDQLNATFDAVLVHPSANESGPWKGKLAGPVNPASNEVAKLFDFSRRLGATTFFIWDSDAPMPNSLMGSARKADTIITTDDRTILPLLELDPSSIRSLGVWDESLELSQRIALALRNGFVPVEPDAPFAAAAAALRDCLPTDNSLIPSTDLPDKTARLERIDIYTNSAMEDFENQSLPRELYRLHPLAGSIDASHGEGDYFLVLDSDDALPEDYLLGLWVSAREDAIVAPANNGSRLHEWSPSDGLLMGHLYPRRFLEISPLPIVPATPLS